MIAIFALRRPGSDGALEERIRRLEEEVRRLRGTQPAVEPVAAAPPAPEQGAEPVAAEPGQVPAPDPAPDPAPAPGPEPEPLRLPEPPEPPAVQIDWERWIGVRGAAVLGGVVLALAGLFFFRYSIEHGLIPPWLRVVLGTIVGCGCLVAADVMRRRQYGGTADAVAGAGIVVLYAAFWAAANLYDLIGTGTLFVLLVMVTVTCGALSWRHQSLVIAVLGLVGGFLTPIFASRGSDNPIGLFAYLMLLDVAVLFLARRRGWPLLALMALVCTAAYQALWIGDRMGPDRVLLGLGIIAVFAVVFAAGTERGEERSDGRGGRTWFWTQAGAVLIPFAFALYFATNADLGERLVPLALLLVVLASAASWLSRVHGEPSLAVGAAASIVAVVGVWTAENSATTGVAWQLAIACVVLAGIFHGFVERDPSGPGTAGIVSAVGLCGVLIASAVVEPGDVGLWPWLAGWTGLAALLLRQGGFPDRERLQLVAATFLAIGLAAFRGVHRWAEGFPSTGAYLAVVLAVAVALQVVAMRRAEGRPRRYGEEAAALFAVATMLLIVVMIGDASFLALGTATALGILATLAATRLGGSWWGLVAMTATAFAHTSWGMDRPEPTTLGFVAQAATVVLFTLWPFLTTDRLRGTRWPWWTAALTGPMWFVSLGQLFSSRFGEAAIGLLPLGLGAVTLAAAQRTRAEFAPGDPARTSNLAWFLGVTTAFVTVAIPLQLDREWITIGWALEGLALMMLWQRLDHPGLKYVGLALLAAVTIRLVVNDAVLTYHARPALRIVNWLLYTYLVPAAALLRASTLLAPLEVPRLREWERPVYGERPFGAMGAGLAGLVVVFAWINLAIAEWFTVGPDLTLDFSRLPARDLTTSIAWACYALGLLALGVRRHSVGLRWASLGLMMLTIAKVFLYDLGELGDLYRVASLLGLALSLIGVSLAYQRFVLRREPSADPSGE